MTEENQQPNKELEEYKKQAEEYLNNWKRERADFVNYKKDEAKRMEEFIKFASEGIIIELIDVIDAIEVARKQLPEFKELEAWKMGFDSSLGKLNKFLEKFGVKKVEIKDGKFDPNFHEIVFSESKESMPEGFSTDYMEEVRPGYTMHGKLIRPARVKMVAHKVN